jgi:protein arginine kinase
VTLDDLLQKRGEWLRGEGPESDIVVSTRIRLARNLAEFPFGPRASQQDRERIEEILGQVVTESSLFEDTLFLEVDKLSELDRHFLVERQLMSREHAEASHPRALVVHPTEKFSLMINEEDHLRIQAVQSGFNLHTCWELINQVDDEIEKYVVYAFDEKFGYLTACPTNVGTGMRVSVMLHLPALGITRQIDKVFRSLQKLSLAVRGLYGEGSQAMGDFYQISNQITLGRSEEDILKNIGDIVPTILNYERQARNFLLKESHDQLHDRISRAYGILRTAQMISSEEAMHLLSSVRMGVTLKLIEDLDIPFLNDLFLHMQPAHLQKLVGVELDGDDRNLERAKFLREQLGRRASAGQQKSQ